MHPTDKPQPQREVGIPTRYDAGMGWNEFHTRTRYPDTTD